MSRTAKTISKASAKQIVNIGKRITSLRKKAGYPNYEIFAYEHGFSRSQYGRYEKGTDLHFSSILKVVEAHKMSVTEFFSEGFD